MNTLTTARLARDRISTIVKFMPTAAAIGVVSEVLNELAAKNFTETQRCQTTSSVAAKAGAKKRSAARRPTRRSS